MQIAVILKSVYGAPKLYPANDAAHALAAIAGTKTLEPRVLVLAKEKLGAVVVALNDDAQFVKQMIGEAA